LEAQQIGFFGHLVFHYDCVCSDIITELLQELPVYCCYTNRRWPPSTVFTVQGNTHTELVHSCVWL